jgi:phenylacetate-CoA ligase
VQSENVLLEVLDDEGHPCAPGQTGRLVITALHNYATPLIRYEIGDHAQVGEPCDCGRGLPVLTRILGRTRNMLVLPNGEQHWPIVGFREFRDIAPISQYQFVQKSTRELLARFVMERPITEAQEKQLTAHIQKSLGHPFAIRFEYLDSIPRGKTGKYEEFVCEVS